MMTNSNGHCPFMYTKFDDQQAATLIDVPKLSIVRPNVMCLPGFFIKFDKPNSVVRHICSEIQSFKCSI